MNAKTNAQGKDRKNLVKAIAEITRQDARYNGAPTFTYTIGKYKVERDGSITADDKGWLEALAASLGIQGFEIEMPESETPAEETTTEEPEEEMTTDSWTLTMPRDGFTEAQVENLEKIIASKANLIRKALDCADPTVVLTEDRVAFPWYKRPLGCEESMAAMQFITALCRMAKNAKRVTAKETEVPNEKYAFRCFLLRLGFIGAEFKETRKTLLKRLEGSSAFRTTEGHEAGQAESEA